MLLSIHDNSNSLFKLWSVLSGWDGKTSTRDPLLACIAICIRSHWPNDNAYNFLLVEKFDEAQALRTELSKKQQVHMYK